MNRNNAGKISMHILSFRLLGVSFYLFAGLALSLFVPKTAVAQNLSPGEQQILANVTVTDDKGDYVSGLDRSVFSVFDGKNIQKMSLFHAGDMPASVGIIVDSSISMRLGDTQTSVGSNLLGDLISKFIKQGNQSNDYFVVGFNEKPELIADWNTNAASIGDVISSLKRKGRTALYDACFMGIEKLGQAKHQKRVLLLMTDGRGDSASQRKKKELQRLLMRRPDVLFYSVALPYNPREPFLDSQPLIDLTSPSGGRPFFTKDTKELSSALDLIALELKHQYLIGFTFQNASRELRLKIKLTPPPNAARQMSEFTIRSPEKILAP